MLKRELFFLVIVNDICLPDFSVGVHALSLGPPPVCLALWQQHGWCVPATVDCWGRGRVNRASSRFGQHDRPWSIETCVTCCSFLIAIISCHRLGRLAWPSRVSYRLPSFTASLLHFHAWFFSLLNLSEGKGGGDFAESCKCCFAHSLTSFFLVIAELKAKLLRKCIKSRGIGLDHPSTLCFLPFVVEPISCFAAKSPLPVATLR